MKTLALLTASALLLSPTVSFGQNSASYDLSFVATWSSSTHPTAYPPGAHFSPLIGGTHSMDGQFWQDGGIATNGIEVMAETGSPTPLRNEILADISGGTAGTLVQGPGITSPSGTSTSFTATAANPLVTVVTMIAPSPDWFIGVDSLDLRPGGQWLHEVTVNLYAWDSGTDNGTAFTSSNSNTNPPDPISLQTGGPFFAAVPLGTFTFTRTTPAAEYCNGDGGDQLGCTDCPCGNEATPGTVGGCLNSASRSARLLCSGSASVSADTLRFELRDAPASAFSILTAGDTLAPTGMANPCFGSGNGVQAIAFDGLRCAVVNTRRHGGRAANANGDVGTTGPGWGGVDNPQIGLAAQGGYPAGQTRFFQVIYRDDPALSCMRGLNTTQAVGTTFTP